MIFKMAINPPPFQREKLQYHQLRKENPPPQETIIFDFSDDTPSLKNLEQIPYNRSTEENIEIKTEIKEEDSAALTPRGFIYPACSAHFLHEDSFIEHISKDHCPS